MHFFELTIPRRKGEPIKEKIEIGDDISICVTSRGQPDERVRIGIDAPKKYHISRTGPNGEFSRNKNARPMCASRADLSKYRFFSSDRLRKALRA